MFPPSTSPEEVQIKSAMKLPNDLKKKKKKKTKEEEENRNLDWLWRKLKF